MAKRVSKRPERFNAAQVSDIYSVSEHMSENFSDYIPFWKHNGYWLFDSPEVIKNVARENSIPLEGTSLFYHEVHEKEFDGEHWRPFAPESFATAVLVPWKKRLEGFDVVTFFAKTSPECLRYPAISWQRSSARMPTVCLIPSRTPKQTSTIRYSKTPSQAPIEYLPSIP